MQDQQDLGGGEAGGSQVWMAQAVNQLGLQGLVGLTGWVEEVDPGQTAHTGQC